MGYRLMNLLCMHEIGENKLSIDAIEVIKRKSHGKSHNKKYELTINFHPDRHSIDNKPILLKLAETNEIMNQFQTQTSNGGLTAYKGGDRWKWENKIFDGIYDNKNNSERPKYGSLNYSSIKVGASPRFGSAYFKLKEHVLKRTTFCYPDSYFNPTSFSIYDNVESLVEQSQKSHADILDNYIEAHIHGKISISDDIEALVLDPIFKNTEIEKLANELPCKIGWHSGFSIDISIIKDNPDYRGEKYYQIATKIAVNNIIDPQIIGLNEKLNKFESQDLKKIWHYVARYGFDYEK